MIDGDYVDSLTSFLGKRGVRFDQGLSDAEVRDVELKYGFTFPPDLRLLLQRALPVSETFPNWRGAERALWKRLYWPLKGMIFDIEQEAFWLASWGARPAMPEERRKVARDAVKAAPHLVPVYGRRYMPDEPRAAGNPVLSVYQTDIVYCGSDLPSYMQEEFGFPNPYPSPKAPPRVRFWSDAMDAD